MLQPLSDLLARAASSLSLPYVLKSSSSASLAQAVPAAADAPHAQHHSLGCSEGSQAAGPKALQALLSQGQPGGPLVVTVCPALAPGQAGTQQAVQAEVQQLVQVRVWQRGLQLGRLLQHLPL